MPVLSFHDVAGLDGRPLADSLELSDGRRCRLGVLQSGLFEDDRAALLPPSAGTTPAPRPPSARSPRDRAPSRHESESAVTVNGKWVNMQPAVDTNSLG